MKNLNFRAWHKEEEKMMFVRGMDAKEGNEMTDFHCFWDLKNDEGEDLTFMPSDWFKAAEVVLMQSTGQKGKGDIEIFDGDIFEYDILNGAYIHEVKGIVKYDSEEGCWKFILKEQITNGKPDSDKLNEFSYMSLDEIYYPHLEIIGNIYEQPELLEEK